MGNDKIETVKYETKQQMDALIDKQIKFSSFITDNLFL